MNAPGLIEQLRIEAEWIPLIEQGDRFAPLREWEAQERARLRAERLHAAERAAKWEREQRERWAREVEKRAAHRATREARGPTSIDQYRKRRREELLALGFSTAQANTIMVEELGRMVARARKAGATLKQIAEGAGISVERIRQIEAKASRLSKAQPPIERMLATDYMSEMTLLARFDRKRRREEKRRAMIERRLAA